MDNKCGCSVRVVVEAVYGNLSIARLEPRDPNPDCIHCGGTGTTQAKGTECVSTKSKT